MAVFAELFGIFDHLLVSVQQMLRQYRVPRKRGKSLVGAITATGACLRVLGWRAIFDERRLLVLQRPA